MTNPNRIRGDYGPMGGHADNVGPLAPPDAHKRRRAALTVAERAIAEHWSLETLGAVLDALEIGKGEA